MRSQRNTLILTALLTLATACQREPPVPAATLPSPLTTPTTSTPSPEPSASPPSPTPAPSPDYSVPEVIDADYAQLVVQTLYSLESEALRAMKQDGAVSDRARALLSAIHRPEQIDFQLDGYRQLVADGLQGVRAEPGDQELTVERLVTLQSDCIFVAAHRDFARVVEQPSGGSGLTYVQLLPKVAEADPEGLNPTPWMIGGSVIRSDDSVPEDPCAQ